MCGIRKVEKAVVSCYKAVENTVCKMYNIVECTTVTIYKKIENKFVEKFLYCEIE